MQCWWALELCRPMTVRSTMIIVSLIRSSSWTKEGKKEWAGGADIRKISDPMLTRSRGVCSPKDKKLQERKNSKRAHKEPNCLIYQKKLLSYQKKLLIYQKIDMVVPLVSPVTGKVGKKRRVKTRSRGSRGATWLFWKRGKSRWRGSW